MAPVATMQHCLTFRVGPQWYGVNIDHVLEVTYFVMLTELPAAPPDVLGLMAVRDLVMPVIDLRQRFAVEEAALHLNTPIICVQTPEGPVGLVVDETETVIPVGPEVLAPEEGKESRYIRGVVRAGGDRLVLLVNAARVRAEVPLPEDLVIDPDLLPPAPEAEEAGADPGEE